MSSRTPQRVLRAVGAFTVLLLLLGGLPTLLAATIGDPTVGVPDLLAGDVTDAVLIDLLAAVAWLAWAQFALATAVELVSGLCRTPMPRRIPGVLAGQQQLARVLVTALLLSPAVATALLHTTTPARADTPPPHLVGITATSAVAVAPQAPNAAPADRQQTLRKHARAGRSGARQSEARHAEPSLDLSGKASATVYVVPAAGGPATYWDLAEARLGNGQRWGEIWSLNEGRRQADGSLMTSPRLLRPGWTVLLPDTRDVGQPSSSGPGTPAATHVASDSLHDEVGEVTVRPGDTLSQLAADHGHSDWHDTWHTNAGRIEPDGARFTNPDLIRPGWHLTVPAVGTPGNPATPARDAAPRPIQPLIELPTPPVAPAPAPAATDPASAPAAVGGLVPDVAERTAAPRSTSPMTATAADPRHGAATNSVGDANATARSEPTALVAFGGAGALLAGLTLAALGRHRRRQFRHRTLGRTIAATPTELAPAEKALLTCGADGGTADVTWLDEALRSLVHSLAASPEGRLPEVVAVRMTHDVLELVLTAPHPDPPVPWRVEQGGLRWSVGRADRLNYATADRDYHFAPYPALVTVGTGASGEYWLLDLERIGVLTLTGDPERCADLGRFLAAELAHNYWSEQLNVTLVGFGSELDALNPCRVGSATGRRDLRQTLRTLHSALRDNTAITAQAGTDTLTGRLRMLDGDGWPPDLLLIAPTSPEAAEDTDGLEQLLAALYATPDRTAVAVVLVGDPATPQGREEPAGSSGGWQLHLDDTGTFTLPWLGVQVQAQQLPAEEAADLAALLALAADGPDQTMPPARGAQPWDSYADAAGAPLPDLTGQRPDSTETNPAEADNPTGQPPPDLAAVPSVLPKPSSVYLERTATTAADLQALAPAVSTAVRTQVEDADPELDTDLKDWHDPDSQRPKLALLGPIRLTATGRPPAKRPAFFSEVLAYLVSRPLGASLEQFGADLWPNVPDIATSTSPRQAASMVRTWLGENPRTRQPYLRTAPGHASGVGVYQVQDVLVDAELFRRLRLRAVAGCADGLADLEAALQLVTGAVLDNRRPKGYGWLVDLPIEREYLAMIVDVAHLVATHHLAVDAPDRAEAAALTALRAGACDDIALLDLVAACDAAGNQAEADSYVRRILDNHDAEVEEDLPARTCEVLHRRRWLPRDPGRGQPT